MFCSCCGTMLPESYDGAFCFCCGAPLHNGGAVPETPALYIGCASPAPEAVLQIAARLDAGGWNVFVNGAAFYTAAGAQANAPQKTSAVYLQICTENPLYAPGLKETLCTALNEYKAVVLCSLNGTEEDALARALRSLQVWGVQTATPQTLPRVLEALRSPMPQPQWLQPDPLPYPPREPAPQNYGMPQPSAPPPQNYGMPQPYAMPQAYGMAPSSGFSMSEKAARQPKEKQNKVRFSVVTDTGIKPGASAVADVLMYTKTQRRIVNRALREAKGRKTEAVKSLNRVQVRRGSAVTVLIRSADAQIECDQETQVWNGNALVFSFRFTLPADYTKRQADFTCEVLFDNIHILRLYFSVRLNSDSGVPASVIRKDTRKAFVSYSHHDKQAVVNRLTAIQSAAPKLRFWMDNQSMNPGDLWRNEIRTAISKADSFLLFWSQHARSSAEVEKEWRYALEIEQNDSRKAEGAGFITPVPLESPAQCPPPAELNALHFGDPAFDGAIDGIEDVRFLNGKKKYKNLRFMG